MYNHKKFKLNAQIVHVAENWPGHYACTWPLGLGKFFPFAVVTCFLTTDIAT